MIKHERKEIEVRITFRRIKHAVITPPLRVYIPVYVKVCTTGQTKGQKALIFAECLQSGVVV